jgi:hypothetical protein
VSYVEVINSSEKRNEKTPHKYDTLGAIQKSNEKIVERGIQRTKRNKNRYGMHLWILMDFLFL